MKIDALKPAASIILASSLVMSMQANASIVNSTQNDSEADKRISYYLSGMANNSILAAENSVITIPIDVNHQFNTDYIVYADNETISGGIANGMLTLQIEEVSQDTAVNISLVNRNDEMQVALNITVNVLDQPTIAMPNYAIVLNDDSALPAALTGSDILSVRAIAPMTDDNFAEFSPFSASPSTQYKTASTASQPVKAMAAQSRTVPGINNELFKIDKFLSADDAGASPNAGDRKETIITAFKNVAAAYKAEENSPSAAQASSSQPNSGSAGGNDGDGNASTNEQQNAGVGGGSNNAQGGNSNSNGQSNNNSSDGETDSNQNGDEFVSNPSPITPLNGNGDNGSDSLPSNHESIVHQIPEPATSAIFALALAGLVSCKKLKKD